MEIPLRKGNENPKLDRLHRGLGGDNHTECAVGTSQGRERERRAHDRHVVRANTMTVTVAARRWWQSRLGHRLLVEIVLLSALIMSYKYVRLLARDAGEPAIANARRSSAFARATRVSASA